MNTPSHCRTNEHGVYGAKGKAMFSRVLLLRLISFFFVRLRYLGMNKADVRSRAYAIRPYNQAMFRGFPSNCVTPIFVSLFLFFLIKNSDSSHAKKAAPTGILQGIVFEKHTGRPLPNVWIGIQGFFPQQTDRDGAYVFRLPVGRYRLRVWGKDLPQRITQPIPVVQGEVTEALLTLFRKTKRTEVFIEAAIHRYK